MNKRITNLLASIVVLVSMMSGCEKFSETDHDNGVQEDPADYSWDTSAVVRITLNGSSISCEPKVASINGSILTISSSGTYDISGSLTNGQIIVNSKGDANVRLILDGVNIKCSDNAPIYIKNAKKAIIILKENTNNILSDGTNYNIQNSEPNAALFSNSYLTISGEGSLTVNANYNDGISTDDGLLIKSGNITVTAKDDGIRGKDYVKIDNGNISVTSSGDGIKSDNTSDISKGWISIEYGIFNIVSEGDALDAETSVEINDGIFNLTVGGGSAGTSACTGGGFPGAPGSGGSGGYTGAISAKGIKCATDLKIKSGTFVINSADDALHSNANITINGGNFSLSTKDDGIHAETSVIINEGDINISKSYEAIESASITVNKGNVILNATNDGFNATNGSGGEFNDGSILQINGGNIAVSVTSGDGLDSNGNIEMTGGTVIVHGPQSAPEVAFDFNGTFSISGGILVAGGPNSGNMIEVPGQSSSQFCIKATSTAVIASSTLFHIEDTQGNEVLTFRPVRNTYYFVFSSPELKNGSTYKIYTGGTTDGTNNNGYYTGGTYSGGVLKKTFTISSKISSISF